MAFIPFIHFLPKKIFRYIIRFFGHKYLSLEKNLNLLTERDLRDYCYKLNIKNFKIKRYKLFGLTSNLILIIKKVEVMNKLKTSEIQSSEIFRVVSQKHAVF